jgi:hypothetical protein
MVAVPTLNSPAGIHDPLNNCLQILNIIIEYTLQQRQTMKTGIYRQQSAKIRINVKIFIFRLCETELIFFFASL